MDKFLDNRRIKQIEDTLEYSWLNLDESEFLHPILSPFSTDNKEFVDNPHLHVLRLMKNPEYFYFTCKYIFNIEVLPLHLAVLKALWTHKYPMILASRGFGKCCNGQSRLVNNDGICKIGDLLGDLQPGEKRHFNSLKSQNESGGFNDIEYGWNNGLTPSKKIETFQGFEFEGTLDHPIRIARDGEIKWVELKDVKNGDEVIIDRTQVWFKNVVETGIDVYELGYYLDKESCDNNVDIPKCIFKAPKHEVANFLQGLFDSYGIWEQRRMVYHSINLEKLKDIQYLLTKFGVISQLTKNPNELTFSKEEYFNYLKNVKGQVIESGPIDYYYDKITKIQDSSCITYDIHCAGDDHSFNSNGFISHNTFYLAIYSMIKALFVQNSKIVVVGAGFRQAKYVFNYCETIWNNAPILRSLVGDNHLNGPKKDSDRWVLKLGNSYITALPMGPDGSKIRGERATCIISDEFSSMNYEVYQTVVSGFASVRANPSINAKHVSKVKRLKELGQWTPQDEEEEAVRNLGNQAIIAGTPTYQTNHFYREWSRYKAIIETRGDKKKIQQLIGDMDQKHFNYKDYCVVRIPFELIPEGFMDESHIARSKATMDSGIYNMEFGACFNIDSNGFFRKSLIDGCTSPVNLTEGKIEFPPASHGQQDYKYVIGFDSASEKDNFAIVVLEVHRTHRRVVYCWTTNKITFRERMEKKLTEHTSYYSYCARKIRDLVRLFPTEYIAYDTQGGGYAVEEALHQITELKEGEVLWWQFVDDNKEKECDTYPGKHILYPVQMASADYTVESNHGLKKDMAGKELLFPYVDSISYVMADEEDREQGRLFDTLEDCVWEIEQLKDELTTITHTQTENGRDKWSTPEFKTHDNKRGRLKKDRYSALLMANMLARQVALVYHHQNHSGAVGGFANQFKKNKDKEESYSNAPKWFVAPDYSEYNSR